MDETSSSAAGSSVEIYDSPLAVLAWLILCVGLLLSSTFLWDWGAFGVIIFGTHAVYAGARLLHRPVRLRITEEGIVDRIVWPSAGLIRWEEILELRPTRWGLIEIRLRDPDAFMEQRSTLFQLSRFKVLIRGWSPAVLFSLFLTGSRKHLLEQLESGLDAFTLTAVRQDRVLEAVER